MKNYDPKIAGSFQSIPKKYLILFLEKNIFEIILDVTSKS